MAVTPERLTLSLNNTASFTMADIMSNERIVIQSISIFNPAPADATVTLSTDTGLLTLVKATIEFNQSMILTDFKHVQTGLASSAMTFSTTAAPGQETQFSINYTKITL